MLNYSMNIVIVFFIYVLMIFMIGSLLGMPIINLVGGSELITNESIIKYTSFLLAIGLIYPLLRILGISDWRRIGYVDNGSDSIKKLIQCFFIGIACAAPIIIMLFVMNIRYLDLHMDRILAEFPLALVSAIIGSFLIGFFEETFFRGILINRPYKESLTNVIFLSSIFYASMHFFSPALPENTLMSLNDGFSAYLAALPNLIPNSTSIDDYACLFVLGVLFSLIRVRYKSIVTTIGIHAGLVFSIKMLKHFTDQTPRPYNKYSYLVGDYDHVLGYMSLIWLTLLCIIFYYSHAPKLQQRKRKFNAIGKII